MFYRYNIKTNNWVKDVPLRDNIGDYLCPILGTMAPASEKENRDPERWKSESFPKTRKRCI
jgi:hypothetical protein